MATKRTKTKSTAAAQAAVLDEQWLLQWEWFGGYQFEKLREYWPARGAEIVRHVVNREEFLKPLIEVVEAREVHDAQAEAIDFRLFWAHPVERRKQLFAQLVENFVLWALQARERYRRTPKRTPAEHRSRFNSAADMAQKLVEFIDEERIYGFDGMSGELQDGLRELADHAREVASNPPLQRPRAKDGERTYVARRIASAFIAFTGGLRHAAAATLLNAVFELDGLEPVDATYMQSISRKVPREFDED
jgi:hypothetical protein